MPQTIQRVYKLVKARVWNGQTVTDAFPCQKALKQGEVTSPLLFSLFINELSQDIIRNGIHGVQPFPDIVELFIYLFAEQQTQLNVLARNASDLDLHFNLDKLERASYVSGELL